MADDKLEGVPKGAAIHLPLPASREAEFWVSLLLPIYLHEFPHDRLNARARVVLIVDRFLESLNQYYAL